MAHAGKTFMSVDIDVLKEDYETTRDLVSNPKNNHRGFNDIIKDFKEKGGELLGIGSQGYVLAHPKWKFVMKLFNDPAYLVFVRFCLKNHRKSFPVFYDKPRKIVPNFKRYRNWEYIYIVKMERLEPISEEEYLDIDYYIIYGNVDFSIHPNNDIWKKTEIKIREIEKKHPSIKTLLKDHDFLMRSGVSGTPDISRNNIMKRKNGEIVLADPLWVGETPYQTDSRLRKAERGEYDESPATTLRGGEKWKNLKSQKPHRTISNDAALPF